MNQNFNVINFHLTEKCNYKCKYCFAKFNNEEELSVDEWISASNIVNEYYKRNGINGRINLAGGEPLVMEGFDRLINHISSLGIKVSIITNASLLTKEKIKNWIGKVDTIGISIDSLDKVTNLKIGRNSNGKTIDIDKLIDILTYSKNNEIKIKVNTVVSKFNIDEDISSLYEKVEFDRIKILQVRINDNCNEAAKKYEVSSEEFIIYCDKIKSKETIIIESEDMLESSYVIVDPKGNIISNKGNNQKKVDSIFSASLEKLIEQAEINHITFKKRYQTTKGVNKCTYK